MQLFVRGLLPVCYRHVTTFVTALYYTKVSGPLKISVTDLDEVCMNVLNLLNSQPNAIVPTLTRPNLFASCTCR